MNAVSDVLLVLAFFWPLLLGVLWPLLKHKPVFMLLCQWAAIPALVAAVIVPTGFALDVPWFLLDMTLAMDQIARLFLLATAIIWLVASIAIPISQRKLHVWFLYTMFANFALLLAQDIPSFICFYAFMSLVSYGLIIFDQSLDARRSANLYLGFAILAEVLLLSGLINVHADLGNQPLLQGTQYTLDPINMGLLIFGFGIKAGLFLVHFTLPLVYRAAPLAAVVAMGGAMLHAGIFGWIRYLPFGLTTPRWAVVLLILGLSGALMGVVFGLTQRQPRILLAYSSISQAGVMCAAIGMILLTPSLATFGIEILTLYAVHHALVKASLFYALGVQGALRKLVWLPALSLAGFPLTSGANIKLALKGLIVEVPIELQATLIFLFAISAIGTVLLMGRYIYLILFLQPRVHEEVALMPIPWLLLVSSSVIVPIYVTWVFERELISWPLSWPFAVGVITVGLFMFLTHLKKLPQVVPVPAGDFLLLFEKIYVRIKATISPAIHAHAPIKEIHEFEIWKKPTYWFPDLIQNKLGSWRASALLFVSLSVLLAILLTID